MSCPCSLASLGCPLTPNSEICRTGRSPVSGRMSRYLVVMIAALCCMSARSAPGASPSTVPASHILDSADVNAWLDGLLLYPLRFADIPGGVVVIVRDGQVVTERGFGYADLEARTPVDPKSTLFRPGSVSKLITWTAVMQQVQAGKIDLDADVNRYLDFEIPARNGKPITMRNLLTHTAGFEETLKNLYAKDAKTLLTLGDYLKSWTPHRIFDPGEQAAYSNYGAALAGYIVERVSGESFNKYVARRIFDPLGMTQSTFQQPLPQNLASHMAKGYIEAAKQPQSFELLNVAPAGSLSTTGDDMAKFMMAHLAEGTYGGAQILEPQTTRLMHQQSFVQTPPLPGMALGFYREDRNGHVIIGHAGDTGLFHSDLHLFLDDKVGLFVSFNCAGKHGEVGPFRSVLLREFADRYFPAPSHEVLPTWSDAKVDGAKMVGAYILNRRSDSNFLRVLSALEPIKVTMDADNNLSVSALKTPGGDPRRWREIGRLYWQEVNGSSYLAPRFVEGRYLGLMSDNRPPVMLLQPAPLWANLTPLYVSVTYLALWLLLWPIAVVARAHYGRKFALTGAAAKAYRLIRFAAVADLLVLAGWAALLATMISSDLAEQTDAINPWLRLLEVFGVVPIVAAMIGVWNVTVVWRDTGRGWAAKLGSVFVLLALLGVLLEVFALHLIGWSVNF
jgi:CubicO group peptidase (beta-lactamase class C family)